MQTHVIKLNQPLKNAIAIPVRRNALPANRLPAANDPDSPDKLPKTATDGPATTALPHPEVLQLFEKMGQQVEELAQHQRQTLLEFQELTIRLASEIASAVVQYEVTHHEKRIRNIVEANLIERGKESEHQGPLVVRLNKMDLERVRNCFPDSGPASSSIQWKQDDSIAVGDCEIESKNQNAVAACERQLDDIKLQLMESLHDARVERNELIADDLGS